MAFRYKGCTVTGDFLDEVPNFDNYILSEFVELPARFTKVSESDVEKFIEGDQNETQFDKKLLGLSPPQALLSTVCLNNMIHFGLNGFKEQKELRWGDIVLKTDSDGKEYLQYFECQTKTRSGEDPQNQRPIKP